MEVRVDNGAVILTRTRPKLSLDDLVARTRPEHRHDEIDWGPPVGKETW